MVKRRIAHKNMSSSSDKMKLAVLFSGGKDSCMALHYALKYTDVVCLIIIESKNSESYMFHTPNIRWARLQAEAIGIPAVIVKTEGEKERELRDLERAIKIAKKDHAIDAVVTGAIGSVYQASRVQVITNKLGLECFNPLWQRDQLEHLHELLKEGFDVIIVGTYGEGLEGFIGRRIDKKFIDDARLLEQKLKINPAGEGGEYESFVLDAPYFKKGLLIDDSRTIKDKEGGRLLVIESLVSKGK